jgi:hypothetical protein
MTLSLEKTWFAVCPADAVPEWSGVAALLPDGTQVAIFHLPGQWFGLANVDPCSGAGGGFAGVQTAVRPADRRLLGRRWSVGRGVLGAGE